MPTQTSTITKLTRHIPTAARIILGLAFFVCGLNGFLDFLPHPTEPLSAGAMAFAGGLVQSGYMFPLIKGTEILCGLLLLTNRLVPLALTLLAPVLVNILAFHVFLVPSGTGFAALLVALELIVTWRHRAAFRPLLAVRSPQAQVAQNPQRSVPASVTASAAA